MFLPQIVNLLVVLILIGLLLWVVELIPMDATIKKVIRVVVIVLVCIWLIYFLVGLLPPSYPLRR